MPFLSLVCLTPWQSLFVAEQELKAIINTDPVKRMNNSFFIIVFFVSKGEIKTGNQRRTGKMAFRGEDENSMPELYFIAFERDIQQRFVKIILNQAISVVDFRISYH